MNAAQVSRSELIHLFAGEQQEGEWLTEPCWTLPLALAICRAVKPANPDRLREAVYGDWPRINDLPEVALKTLRLAYEKWVNER